MTQALLQYLRNRVIAAVDCGMSCNGTAERFGMAISSGDRWVRAWRAEGRAEALPQGGDLRSRHIEACREVILAAVAAEADITLVDWPNCSIASTAPRSRPARCGAFSMARPHLKNGARQRAGATRRRRRRQAGFDAQPDLDPETLVFIYEAALSTKMTRLRGRAPRGQ